MMTYIEMIEMVLRSQDILNDDKSKFIASIINEEKAKSIMKGLKMVVSVGGKLLSIIDVNKR